MELKFVAAKKPEVVNVTVQRRQRLVRRIDQQVSLIQSAVDGILPRLSWIWMDEAGDYLLPIKYGRNLLELRKGMYSIHCQNLDDAERALSTVRDMVLKGDFDEQIAAASADIRAKFKA